VSAIATAAATATPLVAVILFLLWAYAHPQTTTYWIAKVGLAFGWASSAIARKALAGVIESKINHFAVSAYRSIQHVDPSGAQIAWVRSDPEVNCALEADGDIVVYLNPERPQAENLSRAALLYISTRFLPRAKLYMSSRQKRSMDLYVTGKLLDQTDPQTATEFFARFLGPETNDDEALAGLVGTYDLMDRAGLFFPVFIQELVFLGEKVALSGARKALQSEVRDLLKFLSERANRMQGDDTVPMYYEGAYCKCGFVVVAKADKLANYGIEPYIHAISEYARQGFENVHVIGRADIGISLDAIVSEAEARTRLIRAVDKEYDAQVRNRSGEWHPTRNRYILLRASRVQRYIGTPQEAITESDL
jgi:hypothetical protein